MVPVWVPIIIRHLIFKVPKKGTLILTTTHIVVRRPRWSIPKPPTTPCCKFRGCVGYRVVDLRFGVQGLGFRIEAAKFVVSDLDSRAWGSGFRLTTLSRFNRVGLDFLFFPTWSSGIASKARRATRRLQLLRLNIGP